MEEQKTTAIQIETTESIEDFYLSLDVPEVEDKYIDII